MKALSLKILALAAGIVAAALIFFPWNSLGGTIFALGARAAADNGIFVTSRSAETSGVFSKRFTYSSVNADFPLFRFTASEVSVTPSILSSIFSSEKKCTLSFGRGSVTPVTRQSLEWNSGTADVTLSPTSVLLENISFAGKMSATGFIEISRETSRIARARVLLKVPSELDRVLEMASRSGMMPISKIKSGEWRIER